MFKTKSGNAEYSSIDVQTDVHTLTTCDSCHIAKDCIRMACNEIEDVIFRSTVYDIKLLKNYLIHPPSNNI